MLATPAAETSDAAVRFWQDCPAPDAARLLPAKALIDLAVTGSPYLAGLILHHCAFAAQVLEGNPEAMLHQLCHDCLNLKSASSFDEIASGLRHKKAEAALLVALADLAQVWDVDHVTNALTQFADACLQAATDFLLLQCAGKGQIKLPDTANPSRGCGYAVLAMGKLGAHELNYSSDVDLIILYDAEIAPLAEAIEPATFFVKFTKQLVSLLQDISAEGYVFRVDLRLRPDPRSTQIAIAIEAAAAYYESQGQNWERAAMIKARPVAGDLVLGQDFLKRITSYIWRKYLDYAAIADIQSLKRQIHAVKGHGEIAVQGHNLKLGRGGIREIELFVQTQQLIAGGRNPSLRGLGTVEMLDALAHANWIAPTAATELKSAYRFLRCLEHRIQMVDDQQSHSVPTAPAAFESFARFSGLASGAELSTKLRTTLETVQRHYAALFEDAVELASDSGSLIFTGGEDDPATIQTLQKMGFAQAAEISSIIRGWHFGRYAAMRNARARELLTELVPTILKNFSQNGAYDQAVFAFDNFLKGLPAGVQLFSMLKANPNLLELMAQILGAAPRLAEQLGHQPRILEAVVRQDFFSVLPNQSQLTAEFDAVIAKTTPREEAMDRARVLAREHQFRVSVRLLAETISAEEAGSAFTAIADVVVQKLLAVCLNEICMAHGAIKGGQCAIIALGKLGGREMTASSDLDLMLVYDHATGADQSDGEKPLSPSQYYARLSQRLVTALTAPTAEGTLFEVDLRLRPSGNQGPVAVSLASFVSYQNDQAWTWEKLALTRARIVGDNGAFEQILFDAVKKALCRQRDVNQTRADVSAMRELMLKEQKTDGPWDIKRSLGGWVDIEFIAQFIQIVGAHENPDLLSQNTMQALKLAGKAGALAAGQMAELVSACAFYNRLMQLQRLALPRQYDPETSPKRLNEAVCRAAAMPDIASSLAFLQETQLRVSGIFTAIIGRKIGSATE